MHKTIYLLVHCPSLALTDPNGVGSTLHSSSHTLVYDCVSEWMNERPLYSDLGPCLKSTKKCLSFTILTD